MQTISERSLTYPATPQLCIDQVVGIPDVLVKEKQALTYNFALNEDLIDDAATPHFHQGNCVQNGFTIADGTPIVSQVGYYTIEAVPFRKPVAIAILL